MLYLAQIYVLLVGLPNHINKLHLNKLANPKHLPNIYANRVTNISSAVIDGVNGVTVGRLQESLRVIYGLDIYQDYNRAPVVYYYPNQSAINQARLAKTPIREALKGELRVGDRYAYWIEIAKPRDGKALTGQITVFLKSDLDKLEAELRTR
jgi:hypothetical protein